METPCPKEVLSALEALVGENVSRETISQLETYVRLLGAESAKYNLIGPKEFPHIWTRHILDSAQLFPLVKNAAGVTDLGTGAGLPGVVLAALGAKNVHLVEATQKKCRFLEIVSRETNLPLHILNQRVEALSVAPTPVCVSRAMAPIARALSWAAGWLKSDHTLIFLKGARAPEEIEAAQAHHVFDVETTPSQTSPEGHIVVIKNFKK